MSAASASTAPDEAEAYRSALRTYPTPRLNEIGQGLGITVLDRPLSYDLPGVIAERIGQHGIAERLMADLPPSARLALGLFAVSERSTWYGEELRFVLRLLGEAPDRPVEILLERGLLASQTDWLRDYEQSKAARPGAPPTRVNTLLRIHPAARAVARVEAVETESLPRAGMVRQTREADGLEALLRLGALWQNVDASPLRRTQSGSLFKRDRERLEEDSALSREPADSLTAIPDLSLFWLNLAQEVGLAVTGSEAEEIVAAPAGYWSDNAAHLPVMLVAAWLRLRGWDEQQGAREAVSELALANPLRIVLLLILASLDDDEWVTLDDLAAFLAARDPRWDRGPAEEVEPAPEPTRPRGKKSAKADPTAVSVVGNVLLGPAYQLGLTRAAETTDGRKAVQVTPAGRYALGLGPPPAPRVTLDRFLFIQPNFEVIAYRQGLNPILIGQLSRFAQWTQFGAAIELKLTPESAYRGLEGGLSPDAILDRLGRYAARPLPAGVAEAVRTWAGRRERVTFHAAATLIEFPSAEALDAALADWPADSAPPPSRVADRLLLVENDRAIPFHRFRLTGSRDYRRPPEACIEVEHDGVTLSLDPARSDLFIEAELARLADELPRPSASSSPRRFRIGRESVARALGNGLTRPVLETWFRERSGDGLPPAVHLLLAACDPDSPRPELARSIVLRAPDGAFLDGLYQHPSTRDMLGDRLGPTTSVVEESAVESLRNALRDLGLESPAVERRGDRAGS